MWHSKRKARAHVVGQPVERPIIAERLLPRLLKDVVLGDKVGGARVQAAGEEGAGDEVEQRLPAKVADEEVVEDALYEKVECVPGGEALHADEAWSEGVEEDLEGAVR